MRKLEEEIRREAKRQILSQEKRFRRLAEEQARINARSVTPTQLSRDVTPEWWSFDPGFDPYRIRKRAEGIASSIQARLEQLSYTPRRPAARSISKVGGGQRTVCVYQVADGAVSKMVFESLTRKNSALLSARAYAYRADLNVQDAIRYIATSWRGRQRLYVAEYDFSAYFDSIKHDFLFRLLHEHFFMSSVEERVISGFLTTPQSKSPYTPTGGAPNPVGIPQGTSISLFLANAAAFHLDRALEDHGVGFVRYADDTLVWSTDYGRITAAADMLSEHAANMGVAVNLNKSDGISVLLPDQARGEIKNKTAVNYLGYEVGLKHVSIRDRNVTKLKHKIATIIYNTLLREPQNKAQVLARVGDQVDRDYAMAIARLRRYLYGDLSEREVRRYARNGAPLRRFKGAMAAFHQTDDLEQLRALDDWIVAHLWLAVSRRGELLQQQGYSGTLPPPHGLDVGKLRKLRVRSVSSGQNIDLRPPSARRIAAIVHERNTRLL